MSLAGRCLVLWRRLLCRMRAENPKVTLRTLAYANYRIASADMAPLGHADGLVISYVPEGWTARQRSSVAAWRQVIGARVLMPPNDWHVGHAAPCLPLHRTGEFLGSALADGIVGYAHDTLFGYWATQVGSPARSTSPSAGPTRHCSDGRACHSDRRGGKVLKRPMPSLAPAAETARTAPDTPHA